jgi:hypothetical protein
LAQYSLAHITYMTIATPKPAQTAASVCAGLSVASISPPASAPFILFYFICIFSQRRQTAASTSPPASAVFFIFL